MHALKIVKEDPPLPLSQVVSIIGIAAGKGGVGKSTVAVQLALTLKKLGYKVGVLDADIYGPSLGQMLPPGMEPVEDEKNPEKMWPGLTLGISYISVSHFRKNASIVRAPVANQIIEQFIHTVSWPRLDYLIIDFPPGTGDIQLTLMQKAPLHGALVVTTPQVVSTLDVRKAIQLFKRMEIPLLGVIENMSYFLTPDTKEAISIFGKGGGEALAKEFSMPVLGQIPLDSEICTAGEEGRAVASEKDFFSPIAHQLIEKIAQLPRGGYQVKQKGAQSLEIHFEDGIKTISLQKLQEQCPCARCQGNGQSVQGVSLLEFSYVGRYAIRVNFSSGCSQGIYPFSQLKLL